MITVWKMKRQRPTALSRRWKRLILTVCVAAIVVYTCLYQLFLARYRFVPADCFRNRATAVKGADVLSAFRKFGYANMTLMQKVEPRPLFNFTLVPWRINPRESMYISKGVIDNHVNWSMVVVVKSHPVYGNRRAMARKTWASFKYLDGVRLETIFVVGKCSNAALETALLAENEKHGDILQIDLEEIYSNVGFKTVAGMQWVSENFPPYWMYSSADDDMMPDLKKLYSDLERLMTSGSKFKLQKETKKSNDFYHDVIPHLPFHCGFRLATGQKPGRKDCLKWCVDYDTYSIDRYPPFCHGGWYSLPVALVSKIYGVSRTLKYFRMDDVWITGLLRLAYFDQINIDHHFGLGKCDEMIGMSPKSPLAATHCQNEQRLISSWKGIQWKILEGAQGYMRIGD